MALAQTQGGAAAGSGAQSESGGASEKVYQFNEVDKPAKILSRPHPDTAGFEGLEGGSGTIMVEAVLSASGAVKDVKVIRPLPGSITSAGREARRRLTESVLRAVYGIKFEPAVKDGKPVSQRIKVAHTFGLGSGVIVGDGAKLVYYPEGCADYSRITPGKTVLFRSKEEARQAGYKKAKSKCLR